MDGQIAGCEYPLARFVRQCNAEHPEFELTVRWSQTGQRPTSIEVRFSAARYGKYYSPRHWRDLKTGLEQQSRNVLCIATNEELYLKGIINVAVATWNPAYREYVVAQTLDWLVGQITGR